MTRRTVVALVVPLLALAGCADAEESPDAGPATAVATPLAEPGEASPTASPSPDAPPSPTTSPTSSTSPSPSPSPTSSASPSPTPSASTATPVLTEEAALEAARRRQVARGDCDLEMAGDAHRVVTTVDQRFLVHVVCFVGAYQSSGELRVWDGLDLAPLPVEQWQSGAVVDSNEVVGFVGFAGRVQGSNVVTNEVRYRGLGDCGLVQSWTFDGEALRLASAREQPCTDDGEFVPSSQWPVVYQR